jgi:hypothetical protein
MTMATIKTLKARDLPTTLTDGLKPDQRVRVTVEPLEPHVARILDHADEIGRQAEEAGLTEEKVWEILEEIDREHRWSRAQG